MIKYLVVLRKKPTLTIEEFRHHWKNIHGPLVSKLPGLKKYVQYHGHSEPRAETENESVDAPFDGLIETWWESADDIKKAFASPEGQAVIEDESTMFGTTNYFIHPVVIEETVEFI